MKHHKTNLCPIHNCKIDIGSACPRCIEESNKLGDKELNYLAGLYDKLKNFYAQPIDAGKYLQPKWIPDISIPHRISFRNVMGFYYEKRLTSLRRLTFMEFCNFFQSKEWHDYRNTINR